MYNSFAGICCFFLVSISAFSQQDSKLRYKDLVFESVIISKNIKYTTHSPSGKEKYSLLDIYEAKDDNNTLRPLIIWMHGGGFKYGKKTSNGTPIWSKTFAQRGYVCAAINYRLSKKKPLRKFPDLVEGCMEAIQDVQAAISFFKKNSDKYRIDTNHIILAGNSAGAITALQAVYSSQYDLAKMINREGYDSLDRSYNSQNVFAVISFWGAILDSTWLQNAKVPVVMVHGSKDKIVSPESKGPVNGSKVIFRNTTTHGIPAALKLYDGFGHELQKSFNPLWAGSKTKKRWLEAGQFAADFLYENMNRH